jgi:hypothetical protein
LRALRTLFYLIRLQLNLALGSDQAIRYLQSMQMSSCSIVTLGIASILGACGINDPPYCDPPVPPNALYVGVRDSVSDRPLARGTIGTADAAGVHDTLITYGDDSTTLYSSRNAPGTYRVVLRRAGYRDWVAEAVKVEWGRCGGGNVGLDARLQAIAPPGSSWPAH